MQPFVVIGTCQEILTHALALSQSELHLVEQHLKIQKLFCFHSRHMPCKFLAILARDSYSTL